MDSDIPEFNAAVAAKTVTVTDGALVAPATAFVSSSGTTASASSASSTSLDSFESGVGITKVLTRIYKGFL